jgi:hypothetical protein
LEFKRNEKMSTTKKIQKFLTFKKCLDSKNA